MSNPTENQPTPRPIANDEDLAEARERTLTIEFLKTLTEEQKRLYLTVSDLSSERNGDLTERAMEAMVSHLSDPGRLLRLLWRHCSTRPVDELGDCCRSWVEP